LKAAQEKVNECNGKRAPEHNIVVLDTAEGHVRLVGQGPIIKAIKGDTSYGILFIVLPPQTGAFNSRISWNADLKQNRFASIQIKFENGNSVNAKIILTGENKPQKPLVFLGVFDRDDKMMLLENNVEKINISSGKASYEYVIKDNYTDKIKVLLSGAVSH
ncbi:MAG TPA: hypothetical protein VEK36_00385, partial [Candidatus Paceibacterota bacterium]|nr:hypothetical protein [Candidatus Paceibacterota bacterium]